MAWTLFADPRRLPLITISIVRTISFTIYTSTKRILNSTTDEPLKPGEKPPWINLHLGVFNKDTAGNVAMTSLLAGAASGAVVCIGSAPFELVKVSYMKPDLNSSNKCRSGGNSSTRSTATRTPSSFDTQTALLPPLPQRMQPPMQQASPNPPPLRLRPRCKQCA